MHAVVTSEKVETEDQEDSVYSFDDIQQSPLSSPTRRSDRMSIKAQQDTLLFTPRPLSPVTVQTDAGSSNSYSVTHPSAARLSLERLVELPTSEDVGELGKEASSSNSIGGGSSSADVTAGLQQSIPLKRPISTHRLALYNNTEQQQQLTASGAVAVNDIATAVSPSAALNFKDHLHLLTEGFRRSPIFNFIAVEINNCTSRASVLETPFVANMPNNSASAATTISGLSADIRLRRAFSYTNDDAGVAPPQRATWWSQFTILSGRSFKNLYRNPSLLRMHYFISLVSAVICGFLFWKLKNDIQGFQNRLGVFFFICALFGFGCLSSMQVGMRSRPIPRSRRRGVLIIICSLEPFLSLDLPRRKVTLHEGTRKPVLQSNHILFIKGKV